MIFNDLLMYYLSLIKKIVIVDFKNLTNHNFVWFCMVFKDMHLKRVEK